MITVTIDIHPGYSSLEDVSTQLRSAGIPLGAEPPYLPLRGSLFCRVNPNKNAVIYRWFDDSEPLYLRDEENSEESVDFAGNTPKVSSYDEQVAKSAEDSGVAGGLIMFVVLAVLAAGIWALILISTLIGRVAQ